MRFFLEFFLAELSQTCLQLIYLFFCLLKSLTRTSLTSSKLAALGHQFFVTPIKRILQKAEPNKIRDGLKNTYCFMKNINQRKSSEMNWVTVRTDYSSLMQESGENRATL